MSKKILVVDDSRTIRQQVTMTLARGGYEVVEAEDGAEGLAALKAAWATIALIISDVNMPKMNGLEMVEAISKDPNMSKVPIIMLTTEGSGDLIRRAKAAGAKGWLVKPFEPDQLLATVNKIVAW